jgi:hypothetical protein
MIEKSKGLMITHILQFRVPNRTNFHGADCTISNHFMVGERQEAGYILEGFCRPVLFPEPKLWDEETVSSHVRIDR